MDGGSEGDGGGEGGGGGGDAFSQHPVQSQPKTADWAQLHVSCMVRHVCPAHGASQGFGDGGGGEGWGVDGGGGSRLYSPMGMGFYPQQHSLRSLSMCRSQTSSLKARKSPCLALYRYCDRPSLFRIPMARRCRRHQYRQMCLQRCRCARARKHHSRWCPTQIDQSRSRSKERPPPALSQRTLRTRRS